MKFNREMARVQLTEMARLKLCDMLDDFEATLNKGEWIASAELVREAARRLRLDWERHYEP